MLVPTTARGAAASFGALCLVISLAACSSASGGATASTSSSAAAAAPSDRAGASASAVPVPSPTVTATAGSSAAPSEYVAEPSAGASLVPGQAGYVQPEASAVALDATAAASDHGVTAHLDTVKSTKGVAGAPGEVSGPAVLVKVTLRNTSGSAVDLSAASVTLTYGDDDTPGSPYLTMDDVSSLPASVGAGRSVSGTYVFAVPKADQEDVAIHVAISTDEPVIVFAGHVS